MTAGGRLLGDGEERRCPRVSIWHKIRAVARGEVEMEDTTVQEFPEFPELGKEDTYYGKLAHKAEKKGEIHKRAAYKVAQYITLAQDPPLSWPDKIQYFR